jgi:hypothetical protein
VRARSRLDRVEARLPALATVLLWLAEAHAFGSLEAYVAWLVNQPVEAWPLVRIPTQIRSRIQASRPARSTSVEAVVRQAIREAVLRFALIVETNRACLAAAVEAEQPHALLLVQAYGFSLEDELAEVRTPDSGVRRKSTDLQRVWRKLVGWQPTSAWAIADARRRLEQSYFNGAAVLFPDIAAWHAGQLAAAEHLVTLVEPWLGTRRGRIDPPPGTADRVLAAARRTGSAMASSAAATIERDARQLAYTLLGDRRAAAMVAAGEIGGDAADRWPLP